MQERHRRFSSPALQYTYDRRIAGDSKARAEFEAAVVAVSIARQAIDLRESAGLTPVSLAQRVGVPHDTILALEDADYDGDALALLQQIAAALEHRVEIRLVPAA